jgi:hypothetical protein
MALRRLLMPTLSPLGHALLIRICRGLLELEHVVAFTIGFAIVKLA